MTLYAVYEKNMCIVTYKDGEKVYDTRKVLCNEAIKNTVSNPTKEQYTFKYWSLEKDGEEYDFSSKVTRDITLYAVYEIKKCNVVYIVDGVQIKTEKYEYGTVLNPEEPTKEGYTFKYWSLNDGGEEYSPITVISDMTLYAVFKINTYTVTFMQQDANRLSSVVIDYNSVILSENIPETQKNGYIFKYWSLDKQTEFDLNTPIKQDKTLYTVYEANKYIISYDNDGEILSETKEVTYDQKYGSLKEVSKEGYAFDGWYTEKTGGVKITEDSVVDILSNTTLYARYNINTYKVTYDYKTNGGKSVSTKVAEVDYNSQIDLSVTAEKDDYEFVGWNTDKTKTEALYLDGVSVKNLTSVNNNVVTLYAIWKVNTYSLSINPNTGVWNTKTDIQKFNLNYGETKEIANPTKEGYSFKSWTLEGAGSLLNQTTFTMEYENASLVANYEPNVYTITLNSSSATTQGTSMIYQKYNTGIYLDSALTTSMTTSSNNINIPSKTGYIFGGYYTKENGSGTMIINENGYITSSITNTTYKNNVTLYAKWTRLTASMISYTDTYNMGCSNVQCAIDKIKDILNN